MNAPAIPPRIAERATELALVLSDSECDEAVSLIAAALLAQMEADCAAVCPSCKIAPPIFDGAEWLHGKIIVCKADAIRAAAEKEGP